MHVTGFAANNQTQVGFSFEAKADFLGCEVNLVGSSDIHRGLSNGLVALHQFNSEQTLLPGSGELTRCGIDGTQRLGIRSNLPGQTVGQRARLAGAIGASSLKRNR